MIDPTWSTGLIDAYQTGDSVRLQANMDRVMRHVSETVMQMEEDVTRNAVIAWLEANGYTVTKVET